MCDVCHKEPCDIRCPNSSDKIHVDKCEKCNYQIPKWEGKYITPDGIFCEECGYEWLNQFWKI